MKEKTKSIIAFLKKIKYFKCTAGKMCVFKLWLMPWNKKNEKISHRAKRGDGETE